MYTRCEIVRYRANSEAVFSLTKDQNVLLTEKQLDGVNQRRTKTRCCGILNSAASLSSQWGSLQF
jgi:hypothetical protein